jgi:hypothetical protein
MMDDPHFSLPVNLPSWSRYIFVPVRAYVGRYLHTSVSNSSILIIGDLIFIRLERLEVVGSSSWGMYIHANHCSGSLG